MEKITDNKRYLYKMESMAERGVCYGINACCWCNRRPDLTRRRTKGGPWKYRVGCTKCRDFTAYFTDEKAAVQAWNSDESILSAKGPALELF